MGYETITTTIEPGAKCWVARTDGEPITREQYKKLKLGIEKHQGGPAHSTFKLQCDHWDKVQPISLTPVKHKWEGTTNHCLWSDMIYCREAAKEIGAIIFGQIHLKELRDGFWVEHFKFQFKRGEPENPVILHGRVEYEPYED
tara:strand:+ start:37 stop:465 length:429 start_codon:yes stop_codon:yes gene_type:complete